MDPIADMLSQIRNAGNAGKQSVKIPYSKLKMAIAQSLAEQGYVVSAEHKGSQPTKIIKIGIAYDESGRPRIQGTDRISKTSRRIYEKAKNLGSVKHEYGNFILSTPQGIMDDKSAKRENVGGEILFAIW